MSLGESSRLHFVSFFLLYSFPRKNDLVPFTNNKNDPPADLNRYGEVFLKKNRPRVGSLVRELF